MRPPMTPKVGEIYHVGPAASVQFSPSILFRVIRVHVYGSTPTGWVWLDGYELDAHGNATSRRTIFVQPDGLIDCNPAPAPRTSPTAGQAQIPRQRAASPRVTSTPGHS